MRRTDLDYTVGWWDGRGFWRVDRPNKDGRTLSPHEKQAVKERVGRGVQRVQRLLADVRIMMNNPRFSLEDIRSTGLGDAREEFEELLLLASFDRINVPKEPEPAFVERKYSAQEMQKLVRRDPQMRSWGQYYAIQARWLQGALDELDAGRFPEDSAERLVAIFGQGRFVKLLSKHIRAGDLGPLRRFLEEARDARAKMIADRRHRRRVLSTRGAGKPRNPIKAVAPSRASARAGRK